MASRAVSPCLDFWIGPDSWTRLARYMSRFLDLRPATAPLRSPDAIRGLGLLNRWPLGASLLVIAPARDRRQAGCYETRCSIRALIAPPQPMLRQLGVEAGAGNAQAFGGLLAIAVGGLQGRQQRLAFGLRQLLGQRLRRAAHRRR